MRVDDPFRGRDGMSEVAVMLTPGSFHAFAVEGGVVVIDCTGEEVVETFRPTCNHSKDPS